MNNPYIAGEYLYRDATAEDKPEVMEMTAHTWEFGDYISYVFDEWLADTTGRFLVAEERASGRIVAIDKLTMLSPTESWFEGLRVHPDFRGRGLAGRLQTYMIGEAARMGARTVRLITLATNQPVHKACYRDGFTLKSVVRFWKWQRGEARKEAALDSQAYKLRRATPDEAGTLHDWWLRSASFRTAGLAHCRWSYAKSSADEWRTAASSGLLLVRNDAIISPDAMPPATVLLRPDTNHSGDPIWVLSALTALSEEWSPLLRGLISIAEEAGVTEINGLQPDTHDVYTGLQEAGFSGDPDEDRLCLFELSPIPVSG